MRQQILRPLPGLTQRKGSRGRPGQAYLPAAAGEVWKMWPRKDLGAAAAAAAGLGAARGYEPACSTASRPASTLSPVRTREKHTRRESRAFASVIQLDHPV